MEQIKKEIEEYMQMYFKNIPYTIGIDTIGDLYLTTTILYCSLIDELKKNNTFLWHCQSTIEKGFYLVKTTFYQIK